MNNPVKTISRGLCVALILGSFLAGCGTKPTLSEEFMEQNVTSFNLDTSRFYDEFVLLQIERVRLAKMAEEREDTIKLLDQMEKIQKQAEKVSDVLDDLYLLASEIEKGEETTFIPFFSTTPVFAKEKHGLVGTIISWTPLVSRFVDAFDHVSEGVRLGIYKTYLKTEKEMGEIDTKDLERIFEDAGFSEPEDIFSCDPFKLREFYQDHYWEFAEEVDFAKIAAETGEQAVLAYVDGILAVTGGDATIPDIPTDVEEYLKIVLGKETVKEYVESKLLGTGFEILEESVTATEEPEEKVTIAVRNSVQEVVTGVLTGQIESSEIPPVEARTGMIAGQIQPYEEWTVEEKRAVAEKINELEEPLMTATKAETEETTNRVLVPEGEWDILSTKEETAPVMIEDAEIEEDAITQIVRMAVTADEIVENYPKAMKEIDQSTALEPGEVWDWESCERIKEAEEAPPEEEPEIEEETPGLIVSADSNEVEEGEVVNLTVTIPDGFGSPFTINIISEGGLGASIVIPSRTESRTFTSQFVASQPGVFKPTIEVIDADGKTVSGSVTIAVGGIIIARGRLLPPPNFLEEWKRGQEQEGAFVYWTREDDNHLQLAFDPTGGPVTGSFKWQKSMKYEFQPEEPGSRASTIVCLHLVDLTGSYSGGEMGGFQGTVEGSFSHTYNGHESAGSLSGTWSAEMGADGQISGTIHYNVNFPTDAFEDWLDFEAAPE